MDAQALRRSNNLPAVCAACYSSQPAPHMQRVHSPMSPPPLPAIGLLSPTAHLVVLRVCQEAHEPNSCRHLQQGWAARHVVGSQLLNTTLPVGQQFAITTIGDHLPGERMDRRLPIGVHTRTHTTFSHTVSNTVPLSLLHTHTHTHTHTFARGPHLVHVHPLQWQALVGVGTRLLPVLPIPQLAVGRLQERWHGCACMGVWGGICMHVYG
jgi:hypothetical protein